ncbi:EAL domain-containing protein [Halomonas sp. MA07-2]|uniref:EAL domain-containing protein n=1 Tax=Halomonas sp. MA07-2 TaxID=3440841 RepID=UPI003EEC8231
MTAAARRQELPTPVVGVGASAGGFEAISQLIRGLDPDLPFAYVMLQHASPADGSMLPETLSRGTLLSVRVLQEGDTPEAGVIHLAPPNVNVVLREGRLSLLPANTEGVPAPSINDFFISLAADTNDNAIGIVLSGIGSDGTVGLGTIMAAGGVTLVQDPVTAKYSGMPQSAIEAGVADFVLTPDAMAGKLAELTLMHVPSQSSAGEEIPVVLLEKLKQRRSIDFSGYKAGTLSRRLRRRMVATGTQTHEQYLMLVEEQPDELDTLARDILISVTAFFRDAGAFNALRSRVVTICQRCRDDGQGIRVWIAGCATGEEAYSIAMLFAEALREVPDAPAVQIFATDIDEEALVVARRGVYPAMAMETVPEALLQDYFHPHNGTFEAGKRLRNMIVFARHNLVEDPPFLHLDLVSCRNVLIYFDNQLQARVLKRFHFALRKRGILFLGRSESAGQSEALFAPLDRRERTYRKQGDPQPHLAKTSKRLSPVVPRQRRDLEIQQLLDGVVAHLGATVALCDGQGNILHTAGNVERVLLVPRGHNKVAIAEAIAAPFRAELLYMLHQIGKSPRVMLGHKRVVDNETWRLSVRPVAANSNLQMMMVMMEPCESPVAKGSPAAPKGLAPAEAEGELQATREHLQSLIEELATANEEMQSLNEEAQNSNEALQATNEEFEAANEEMQATNEELMSLNEELNVKTAELQQLNDEYTHLYDSLEFPILVFDRDYHLRRYNAAASRQFKLRTGALQQHITRLRLPEALLPLESLLSGAISHGEPNDELINLGERLVQMGVTPGIGESQEVELLVVSLVDVTEVTEIQTALKESRVRLDTLMHNTTILLAMKNLSGIYEFANPSFCEAFGLEAQNVMGKNDFELFPEAFAADVWSHDMQALRQQCQVVAEHLLPGAQERVLRTVHQILRDAEGRPVSIITESEDITLRKQAERQLRLSAKVFEQAGEAIVVTDVRGRITSVNTAFSRITGYAAKEAIDQDIGRLMAEDAQESPIVDMMRATLQKQGFWQGEIWSRRKNGETLPLWLTINRIDESDGQHFVGVFADISNLKESQRKVEYLATHDALTGLPNRTLFQDRLDLALAQARRSESPLALMFLDLDNFKAINDTLGHDAGDELLVQVAGRIGRVVREIDTVARLGGDEFTVVLNNTGVEAAELVAQRIVEVLREPVVVQQRSLFVSASIGLAFYPEDGQDASELTKAADTAMYRAKESGRDRFEVFKPELQAKLVHQANMETALRRALKDHLLRLVFQPKFVAADGTLFGAEALLRWHDPELGNIPPNEFIPAAERCGLIMEVDRRVLQLAIEALARWRAQGLVQLPVAINISGASLQNERFLDILLERLCTYGISATLLQVELTERTLVERTSTALGNIERLREAGIALSIDDFGTGYSSLAYLKSLPLSELKIDKGFIDGLGGHLRNDEAIVRAILGMAKALELRTVAEGVETEVQREWLREQGCDLLQGYLMARPEEEADYAGRLASLSGSDITTTPQEQK